MPAFVLLRLSDGDTSYPSSDNTPLARASRAPLYTLATDNLSDIAPLALLRAVFDSDVAETARAAYVRIQLPQSSVLAAALLDLGAAITISALGTREAHNSKSRELPALVLMRAAFWQLGPEVSPWLRVHPTSNIPLTYSNHYIGTSIARAALRPPKTSPGTVIYERYIRSLQQTFSLRVLDVNSASEVALFSAWQNVRMFPRTGKFLVSDQRHRTRGLRRGGFSPAALKSIINTSLTSSSPFTVFLLLAPLTGLTCSTRSTTGSR
jgi:hypothetical protein